MERAKLRDALVRIRALRPPEGLARRAAIVVDDALAVMPAVSAAAFYVKAERASVAVLAVPVAVPALLHAIHDQYDEVTGLEPSGDRIELDEWYGDPTPVSLDWVVRLVVDRR